jgi:iron(III) transport system substrate-binding protein
MTIKTTLTSIALAASMLTTTNVSAETPTLPSYYPANYSALITASKTEKGLVIYSSMADNNWRPVLTGFNKKYPWIKVETMDLATSAVHSRWEAEAGSGSRTADILVSGANDRWARYGLEGKMLAYTSPESSHLPDFAKPYPGVNVMSADPLIITYNTMLLPKGERPTGFNSLVKAAQAQPGKYKGRITTYDAARSPFASAAWSKTLKAMGDGGWANLRSIGPLMRVEMSGGAMNEKIVTGEYLAGIAVSGITIFPRLDKSGGKVLGFVFPDDGTPIMLRGFGITKDTANPNSAKLMVDYLLSNEGQTLIGKGEMTPYRDDVDEREVRYTYQAISDIVGKDKMIVVGFDKALLDETPEFTKRWTAAMSGK